MMNSSMWQKCPVCDGRGIVPDTVSYGSKSCHVCNGHGIISVISGLPPVHNKTTITTSNTTTSNIIKDEQHELYKAEVQSGMFWEWHPELSGIWEQDKEQWLNKKK